jgi:hypothetical protein
MVLTEPGAYGRPIRRWVRQTGGIAKAAFKLPQLQLQKRPWNSERICEN